jgi:Rrf2 family protein
MVRWGQGVDNGIRAVVYLSRQDANRRVPLKEIAEELKASPSFLAKIMQTYSRAGIVSASRGARGGYLLKKTPLEITLRDLVEELLDSTPVGACPMISRICPRQKECSVCAVLVSIEKEVCRLVEGKTLVDLCAGGSAILE